jgi:YgiT-type zinc finger domain-containing protein
MICVICRQAEIVDGLTSVNFETGEVHLVINHVPARVCSSCREAYVEEEIALQLLRMAREMTEAGMFDTQCEYTIS